MEDVFLKKIKPMLEEYGRIFKYYPCPCLYECSDDEFEKALKMAIKQKQELKNFVKRKDNSQLGFYDSVCQ